MPKVFLIAGLGADKRLFKNIRIPEGHEVIYTDWLEPKLTDTLADYSQSIINQYNISDNDIAIGVSLGGVISTEIAKRVNLSKVILISSKRQIQRRRYTSMYSERSLFTSSPRASYLIN